MSPPTNLSAILASKRTHLRFAEKLDASFKTSDRGHSSPPRTWKEDPPRRVRVTAARRLQMEIKVIEDIQRRARDEEEYMARVKEEQDEKEVKSKGDGEEGGGEADVSKQAVDMAEPQPLDLEKLLRHTVYELRYTRAALASINSDLEDSLDEPEPDINAWEIVRERRVWARDMKDIEKEIKDIQDILRRKKDEEEYMATLKAEEEAKAKAERQKKRQTLLKGESVDMEGGNTGGDELEGENEMKT